MCLPFSKSFEIRSQTIVVNLSADYVRSGAELLTADKRHDDYFETHSVLRFVEIVIRKQLSLIAECTIRYTEI